MTAGRSSARTRGRPSKPAAPENGGAAHSAAEKARAEGLSSADYRSRLRLRLLQIGRQIVTEEGLGPLQARRLAAAAECSVGTIYNVFGGLDGLILAINSETLRDFGRTAEAAAQRVSGASLETRLVALAITYLDFATANLLRWKAVFEHRVPADMVVPPTYVEDRERLLALIEGQLKGAISDPETRATAARALFAAVHGIVMLGLDEKLGIFSPAECERQIRFIVAVTAQGFGALEAAASKAPQ